MRHRPAATIGIAVRALLVVAALVTASLWAVIPASAGSGSARFAAVPPPPGLTFEARALLDGHTRVGSWMGIDIHLKNDGPPIAGELRLTGGAQGKTRFGTAVDLPTQSDKTYRMYVQPPGFGRELEISLVSGASTIATTTAKFAIHDATQLVVGIVAERPGDIIADLDLLPNANNLKPVTIAVDVAGLPKRVEAWGALDRLIWQDTDAARLESDQLAAMRGWIAGGGRLVNVGGTAGASSLTAFPDAILPFRPTATTDVAPASLCGLLGGLPAKATELPALAGTLI